MSLRVRHIQLRVQTNGGLYGADLAIDGGLTVIYAPNTSGKSTCLQALLYALGLEQMLSPKREIPLPYAMRTHIDDPVTGVTHAVTESYVAIEIENVAGRRVTVRRNVVGATDRRLISVTDGPKLSDPDGEYGQRDYFVSDPGAAQREAGFHRMLAEFMGWSLPRVKRYDGSDTTLYVETLFPLFYVEQKVGWNSIPAAIPTHFRIRDVAKRSVEFLLALDTHELELKRQELELRLSIQKTQWTATAEEIRSLAATQGMRVQQLTDSPTTLVNDVRSAHLQIFVNEEWRALGNYFASLQEQLEAFDNVQIPEVESLAAEAADEADRLTIEIQELNKERSDIFRGRQAELVQRQATLSRIEQIDEDLKKNRDALKLQQYGSTGGHDLSPQHCPTCDQPVMDALLPQGTIESLMSVDDNIEFLIAQRSIFKRLAERSRIVVQELDLDLLSTSEDVRQKASRLRALKSDMIAPSHAASAAYIEQKLRLDARIQKLASARDRFDALIAQLVGQAEYHEKLLVERAELPNSRFSDTDRGKLSMFEVSIRQQLHKYAFSTFPPEELEVSEDTYRPQKEGFEIGFELSASDAIRLKWAYQMGLLDVSGQVPTNHPGVLVMDEPRQQEAAEASVGGLLKQAAALGSAGKQILIATSEHLTSVRQFVSGLDCHLIVFDGRIIRRIDD